MDKNGGVRVVLLVPGERRIPIEPAPRTARPRMATA
jgi:hypothetical protein